jgi:tripartite-type tricarboxylate transporter receptor subunit TctC
MIRIVVPWPAGGVVDIAARHLGVRLQAAFGQAVVIENRIGGGGNVGADKVAKSPSDGYTLLLTSSALTISKAMGIQRTFDLLKDLEPLALVASAPAILVVGPAIRPESVSKLIEMARTRPFRLSYASTGVGSPSHLTAELFSMSQKFSAVHVPYTGTPGALNAQLTGQVDYQFANAYLAMQQIRLGKIKALAVTGAKRLAAMPQVPTMAETGTPDLDVENWMGLFAPRGLPKPVAERLALEVRKVLSAADLRQVLTQAEIAIPDEGTPAAFEALVRQDLAKWSAVVKAQGIVPE